jgi:hypothetical protein
LSIAAETQEGSNVRFVGFGNRCSSIAIVSSCPPRDETAGLGREPERIARAWVSNQHRTALKESLIKGVECPHGSDAGIGCFRHTAALKHFLIQRVRMLYSQFWLNGKSRLSGRQFAPAKSNAITQKRSQGSAPQTRCDINVIFKPRVATMQFEKISFIFALDRL